MISEHSSKQYDVELQSIRSKILSMGELVTQQFKTAMEVFKSGNLIAAKHVIEDDNRVNYFEIELDTTCSQLIVRRQPAANDLRTIMATIKTITDLERIGDEAVKIARTTINLYHRQSKHPGHGSSDVSESSTMSGPITHRMSLLDHAKTVRGIAQCAEKMLGDALDAVTHLNVRQARDLIAQDEALDHDFRTITRNLATFMMEDPHTISTAIDTMWVAKAIERIGDHATNIAEHVIYMVEGKDIRHHAISHFSRPA